MLIAVTLTSNPNDLNFYNKNQRSVKDTMKSFIFYFLSFLLTEFSLVNFNK